MDLTAELLHTGTTASFYHRMMEFEEFNAVVGLAARSGQTSSSTAGG